VRKTKLASFLTHVNILIDLLKTALVKKVVLITTADPTQQNPTVVCDNIAIGD